jgi:phosphonate transport system ATP-binding protein
MSDILKLSVLPSAALEDHANARVTQSAMMSLRGVTVQRGGNPVLRDVSLDIRAREITAVVGRSGVGKTTLICLLNGLLRPTSGTISVDGVGPLDSPAALREHRCRTGTIFQEHALIDRFPALDNVLLGFADMRHPLSPRRWPDAMVMRAAQSLDEVGLLRKAAKPVSQLSGGERQRVGIARALVRQPKLLLADEPFASVDRILVRQMSEELVGAVARSGLTVVIVLHQIETALAMAGRIIGLTPGGIAYDGPASEFGAAEQALVFAEPAGAERPRKV